MKVVGTGSPTMLTIRLKTSEIPVFRDELEERRAVAIEAMADAQRRTTARDTTIVDSREDRWSEELLLISKVLDELGGRVHDGAPASVRRCLPARPGQSHARRGPRSD